MASGIGILDRVERVLKIFRAAAVVVSAAALFGLVLMITADTFFRYVLLKPFPATVEISQLVEPYVIFLPMAFALASGSHVRVTMFTSRLGPRMGVISDGLAYAIGFAFFVTMTYISWMSFWSSFAINETVLAAIKLYWWSGRFGMPVGMALISIECAYQFVRTLRGANGAARRA
ncbi:MAG: TRAP transporter small permease [Rhodospirillales bacterium]|nr:TRAP transporter small permease [Rhodospirillales bacterium]